MKATLHGKEFYLHRALRNVLVSFNKQGGGESPHASRKNFELPTDTVYPVACIKYYKYIV